VIIISREDVPIWEKYALTVEEAAKYFSIGENKLRKMVHEDEDAPYLICNGTKALFKRVMFEDYLDKQSVI